jgi:hypothetical protein
MGDDAADGGAQRTRLAADQPPEAVVKGGDRLDEEGVRDRLLRGEVVEEGAVGNLAAGADASDRGLRVAVLEEAGQGGVEDPLPGVGDRHRRTE